MSIAIPCLVKQPRQAEVRGVILKNEGDRFLVEVDGEEIFVSKLFVYPDLDNCSSKNTAAEAKQKVLDTSDKCSSKVIPPSKRRRDKGKGSGWIECKPIKRSGKEYKQYWYHYEEWREGDRIIKKSRYIPKRLVAKVKKMEGEKVSVKEILKVLSHENKK